MKAQRAHIKTYKKSAYYHKIVFNDSILLELNTIWTYTLFVKKLILSAEER